MELINACKQLWKSNYKFKLKILQNSTIINDPVRDFDRIKSLVKQGYLVRTRADSGTQEARSNDTVRRNKAFQSGAQAISTDYFLSTNPFDSKYSVSIQAGIRCNPVLISENCPVLE